MRSASPPGALGLHLENYLHQYRHHLHVMAAAWATRIPHSLPAKAGSLNLNLATPII
jgi:hypothetical protein